MHRATPIRNGFWHRQFLQLQLQLRQLLLQREAWWQAH
jgi:hypothetical protein